MWSPGRGEAIMLVEATLAVMRLSCEKFFVLASVLAAYLLFRDEVPGPAVALIRFNHRVSTWIQRVSPCSFNVTKPKLAGWAASQRSTCIHPPRAGDPVPLLSQRLVQMLSFWQNPFSVLPGRR